MSPERPVLMVGWRPRAVAALERHGAAVTCLMRPADRKAADGAGFQGARVIVGDPADAQEDLAALTRAGHRPSDFAVVTSEDEFTLLPAGILASLGGCAGVSAEVAVALRDKYVQKSLIRAAGLPTARCVVVDRPADAVALGAFPLVIKPLAGAGTRDTFLVDSAGALAEHAARLGESSGPWLVEEFMTGTELHIDGVVRDGGVVALGMGRYLAGLIGVHDRGLVASVGMARADHPALHRDAESFANTALKALGHRDGVFHLEVFLGPDGMAFGECAGRVAGGLIRDVTLRQFGVDLDEEWARASLGLPALVRPGASAADGSYGWLHLSAPPGRLAYVPDRDEILTRPGVVEVAMDVRTGDRMPDVSVATNLRAGRVLLRDRDEAGVAGRIKDLDQWFRDRVQVDEPDEEPREERTGHGRC